MNEAKDGINQTKSGPKRDEQTPMFFAFRGDPSIERNFSAAGQ
jgi:hypothetical protein